MDNGDRDELKRGEWGCNEERWQMGRESRDTWELRGQREWHVEETRHRERG